MSLLMEWPSGEENTDVSGCQADNRGWDSGLRGGLGLIREQGNLFPGTGEKTGPREAWVQVSSGHGGLRRSGAASHPAAMSSRSAATRGTPDTNSGCSWLQAHALSSEPLLLHTGWDFVGFLIHSFNVHSPCFYYGSDTHPGTERLTGHVTVNEPCRPSVLGNLCSSSGPRSRQESEDGSLWPLGPGLNDIQLESRAPPGTSAPAPSRPSQALPRPALTHGLPVTLFSKESI